MLQMAGIEAAIVGGMVSDVPRACARSRRKKKPKPVISPAATSIKVPPRRGGRSEKAAAISTMPANSSGSASRP